jgi:uncharacterized membrane protein
MLTLLVLYCLAGCLLIGLALPLLRRKISPNPFYGFRVKATLDDPRIWYAVNEFAARCLIVAGSSILVAAVGLYALPGISVDAYALGCLSVFGIVFGTSG